MSAAAPDWDAVALIASSDYRRWAAESLRAGLVHTREVADDADIHISHASRALSSLEEEALVERAGHGRYELTGKGERALEAVEERAP